LTDGVYVSKTI